MPDNAAAPTAAAASDTKPASPVNPDRVGEELADDANIWHVYERVAREDDERRTKAWDNGLNNLALFAGLFSAVTTAFIIEAQQDMEPDYGQLTFLVLNATASGEKFIQQPFFVPFSARTVNCLWVSSLILSLSAALIAIMGKDWIGMYTARPVCNLRQWAEMRSYRLLCVERWYMSGVIAAAPVLLHVSLLLFGAGLVLFISSDSLTHRLTLGLSLAAGILYLVTTFSAIVFSASPFKSPATQLIRASLSSFFSYLLSIINRPKRNLVRTLLRGSNAMVLPRADETVLFPGFLPDSRELRSHRQPVMFLTAAGGAAISFMRNTPAALRTAQKGLRWSPVRSQVVSIASAVRHIPLRAQFLSSTWTDIPADRRPKLLAEALSWLSRASQAPDVFRAIVFALGDLDIGSQVGPHTSLELRTRLRAEIRRTWQLVDFPTLSRYVLADCNTPGEPVLDYFQFKGRFDLLQEPALRCEEGLAAWIKLSPTYIYPPEFGHYSPSHVTQSRMMEFLLPYIQQTGQNLLDIFILVAHRCRAHLRMGDSFSLSNLESHLYERLHPQARDEYAAEITNSYGGRQGAIELLTFCCCHDEIDVVTKAAAVELVMELLKHAPSCEHEHRCLAYLFGSRRLFDVAWPEKTWSWDCLYSLSTCLEHCCDFQNKSARVQSADLKFYWALARTLVMLLSPRHDTLNVKENWVQFLSYHLCQPRSILDDNGKLDIIRLILKGGALRRIVGKTYLWQRFW